MNRREEGWLVVSRSKWMVLLCSDSLRECGFGLFE